MIRKACRKNRTVRLPRQPGLGPVQARQGQGGARSRLQKAVELQKLEEKNGGRRLRTRPSSSTWATSTSPAGGRKGPQIWAEAESIAARSVPPDKRLPEIRKKLDSLKKLGSLPKSSTSRTPEAPNKRSPREAAVTLRSGHGHGHRGPSVRLTQRGFNSYPRSERDGRTFPFSQHRPSEGARRRQARQALHQALPRRSTWPRATAAATPTPTCASLRDRQGPLFQRARRTTSSGRSRKRPASSAPRTSKRLFTRVTAPAAWPSSARS